MCQSTKKTCGKARSLSNTPIRPTNQINSQGLDGRRSRRQSWDNRGRRSRAAMASRPPWHAKRAQEVLLVEEARHPNIQRERGDSFCILAWLKDKEIESSS